MNVISYDLAKSQGLSKFFTGKACRNGHISERYVCSKACIICMYENEKRYKKSNPKRTTERRKAYREKNHTKLIENDKIYRETHKVERAVNRKNYKKSAIERTPKWFGEFDEFVLFEATDLCQKRAEETGIEWHIDHMYPLKAKKMSGLHCAENFQVIPGVMNVSKSNSLIMTNRYDWLKV